MGHLNLEHVSCRLFITPHNYVYIKSNIILSYKQSYMLDYLGRTQSFLFTQSQNTHTIVITIYVYKGGYINKTDVGIPQLSYITIATLHTVI